MNDECALVGRHGRAHRRRPYQTPLYIYTQHIGGGNASRTPAPILKIKKCVYRYDFGVTVDDVICFKINYSLGATVDDAICFKTSYFFGVTVASP